MQTPASPPSRPPLNTILLIGGLGIAQLIGWGSLVHIFSSFITPMNAEFGWTSAQMTGALTVGLFIGDLASIPVGKWIDRYGGHVILTLGATLGAFLLATWSLIDALWHLYVIWSVMGLAIATTLGTNAATIVTANLTDYRRGLMLLGLVTGLASSVIIPLSSLLIVRFGWREALVIMAFVQFIGCASICALVLRGTVGSRTRPQGVKAHRDEQSLLKIVMRRQAFWSLSFAFAIHWFVTSFSSVHLLPMLLERNMSLDSALSIVALGGPMVLISRFLLLFFDLNTSARRTGRVVFPILCLSFLVLVWSNTSGYWGAVAFAVAYGLSNGVVLIVRQTAIAEIFGIRGYGEISGAITTVSILPRTLSPLAISMLHGWLGGYQPVAWILTGLITLSTVAFYIAAADKGPKI